jgi:hypothetical protein
MMATTNRVRAAKISTVLAALSAAAGSGLLESGELEPCPQLPELNPTESAMAMTMQNVVRIASSSFDTTTSGGLRLADADRQLDRTKTKIGAATCPTVAECGVRGGWVIERARKARGGHSGSSP